MLELAIIGGGAAGLSAGIYACRGGLKNVLMFEKFVAGGAITASSDIENYPGMLNPVDGLAFMDIWIKQAKRFGLETISDEVAELSKDGDTFRLKTAFSGEYEAKAVIVATGRIPKKAGFVGEEKFFGKGVHVCATCDGFFYKNKVVAVIGGGESALEEALYLSKFCKKVYLLNILEKFIATPLAIGRVQKEPFVEIHFNARATEVVEEDGELVGLKAVDELSGEEKEFEVQGIFVFVGSVVNNKVVQNVHGSFLCDVDPSGAIDVDLKMRTTVQGLFAAGDARIDATRQVVCAAGDGAVAAMSAMEYLNTKEQA